MFASNFEMLQKKQSLSIAFENGRKVSPDLPSSAWRSKHLSNMYTFRF
jgi:hypothetical protein